MKCYNCGITITPTNWSSEHIINRSIGGHFTSRDLLCQTCNSKFGSTIDAALNAQLADYGFHLNIDLQWGEHEGFRYLSTIDGKKIRVGPGLEPHYTIREVMGEQVLWQYPVAPSLFSQHLVQKKKELEKKTSGEVIVNEHIVPPTNDKFYMIFNETSSADEAAFGGKDCFRSIAKMCLNYYLYNKFPAKYCKSVLSYVQGKADGILPTYYYPSNERIHDLEDGEVSHILHLRGISEQRILYAYIELFNFIQMIVPFSFEYTGRDLSCTYSWDLLHAVELKKDLNLRLVRHHLQDLPVLHNGMAYRMGALRNRLLQIIEKRSISE